MWKIISQVSGAGIQSLNHYNHEFLFQPLDQGNKPPTNCQIKNTLYLMSRLQGLLFNKCKISQFIFYLNRPSLQLHDRILKKNH